MIIILTMKKQLFFAVSMLLYLPVLAFAQEGELISDLEKIGKVENNIPRMNISIGEEKLSPRKERQYIQLTYDDIAVIHGINNFSFRLLNALDQRESVIISPLSIACLLSMTNNGACGKTQKEINKMLKCTPKVANSFYNKMIPFLTDSRYGAKFNMANALFVDPLFQIKPLFQQEADRNYKALVRRVVNVEDVNKWCKYQTNGMIPSIYDSPLAGASMMALNAVYFESLWKNDFDVADTKDDYFTMEDGTRKKMPIMHQERGYLYGKGKNFSIMEMPYKGEIEYTITFLLPDTDHTLQQVLGQFNVEKWQKARSEMHRYRVDVKLPRFKTESELLLIPVMKKLGILSAFDMEQADFRNLVNLNPSDHICISEMKQKSAIEVNEKGTKAAVVTEEKIRVTGRGVTMENISFHATRPFAYIISEARTGTIIFMGTYYGDSI